MRRLLRVEETPEVEAIEEVEATAEETPEVQAIEEAEATPRLRLLLRKLQRLILPLRKLQNKRILKK